VPKGFCIVPEEGARAGSRAGGTAATTGLTGLPLSPWAGIGVLAAWAAGALLLGGLLFRRRDA